MDLKMLDGLVGKAHRPSYEASVRRYERLLERFPDAEAAPWWRDHLDRYRAILADLDDQENA